MRSDFPHDANCLLDIYNILVVLEHNKGLHGQTIVLLHIIASILLCGMLNITTDKYCTQKIQQYKLKYE